MGTLEEFLRPELIWFLVGIVMLVLEFALPGLIIFFFGIGACIVSAVCFVSRISLNTQLIIFIVSSVVLLLLLRNRLKAVFVGHSSDKQDMLEDLNEYIGQKATVIEKIVPNVGGKVEFHGTNWMAQADEEIAENQVVEITGKDNLTLKVKTL